MRTVTTLTRQPVTSFRPSQQTNDAKFTKSRTVYLGWRDRQNVLYWYCLKGDLDYILAGSYVDRKGRNKTIPGGNLYIEGTPVADKVLLPRRHFLARAVHRLYDPNGIWWNLVEQTYNYQALLKNTDSETLERLNILDVPAEVDPLINHLDLCKFLLKDIIKRQSVGLNDSDAQKLNIGAFLDIADNLTWPVMMKTPLNTTNFQYDLGVCSQDRKYQICC